MDVTLANREGQFDPTNPDSPFAPYLRAETPIRARAYWDGVWYYLFTGFIEEWPPVRNGPRDSAVTVTGSDVFDLLSAGKTNHYRPQQRSGTRISAELDDYGWPGAQSDIDQGNSGVQEQAGNTAGFDETVARMTDAAMAEGGQLYVNGRGYVVFEDRHARLLSIDSSIVFGDAEDGEEVPYVALEYAVERETIRNHVVVTLRVPESVTTGGDPVPQEVEDLESIHLYQRRTYEVPDMPLTSDDRCMELAQWLLSRYKESHVRTRTLTVHGQMDWNLLAPVILGAGVSQRIDVVHRPPGMDAITLTGYVEGKEIAFTSEGGLRMECSFTVSPRDAWDYWILEDSVLSLLGITTRLAL
jgi:hypothetical protein